MDLVRIFSCLNIPPGAVESLSVQALQEGGLWVQKGKNPLQLNIHFYCEDMGGLMLLEDLLGEVLKLQMDFQLKSLHHLERWGFHAL